MTELELFKLVREIITKVVGIECILGDPNEYAPEGLYAAVRIHDGIEFRGSPIQVDKVNGDLTKTTKYKHQCKSTLAINFYRKGALEAASKLKNCNFRSDVRSLLIRNKVSWVSNSTITNLSSLESANIEERAYIQVVLGYELVDEITINTIEKCPIKVIDEKSNVLVDITI